MVGNTQIKNSRQTGGVIIYNLKTKKMKVTEVMFTKGDATGTIDELVTWLKKAKAEGATHYKMDWSHDPKWDFKWFNTYRIVSDDELKQEKINKLKNELKELEN